MKSFNRAWQVAFVLLLIGVTSVVAQTQWWMEEPGRLLQTSLRETDGGLDALPNERTAANPDFVRLAKAGHIVVAFQPRGLFGEPLPNPNQLALGQYMPELRCAIAIGKTIIGMRVDDMIRAINRPSSRPDVTKSSITLYGKGAQGMVALHAAALETRITEVVIENTLGSYRTALEAGLHRNLSEVDMPGVLNYYDVGDLLQAISPRAITIINPVNAMGQPLRLSIANTELSAAFETDRNLGTPQRIRLLKRGFREPLPLK